MSRGRQSPDADRREHARLAAMRVEVQRLETFLAESAQRAALAALADEYNAPVFQAALRAVIAHRDALVRRADRLEKRVRRTEARERYLRGRAASG